MLILQSHDFSQLGFEVSEYLLVREDNRMNRNEILDTPNNFWNRILWVLILILLSFNINEPNIQILKITILSDIHAHHFTDYSMTTHNSSYSSQSSGNSQFKTKHKWDSEKKTEIKCGWPQTNKIL